jgi:hypothetical protein
MRSVVPIRLGDAEREQIAHAAARLKLPLSSFIRQSALQSSAVVERKASPRTKPKQPEPDPEPRELVVVDAEPHYVDGEPVYR